MCCGILFPHSVAQPVLALRASTACTPAGVHPPGQVNALAPMRLIRSLAPKMCDKGEVRAAPASARVAARAETAGVGTLVLCLLHARKAVIPWCPCWQGQAADQLIPAG